MATFIQGESDPNVGIDVDNTPNFSITTPEGDTINYGSYDVVKRPIVSGASDNYIIPSEPDLGIPTLQSNGQYGMTSFYDKRQGSDEPIIDEMLFSNNGRVLDVFTSGKVELPKLKDNVLFHDNQETSIKGLLEENQVTDVFFSDANIESLQMSIRYGVNQRTKQVISKQSENELYIIMRSIMLQYGNFTNNVNEVIQHVKELNAKVITYCVDNVSSNVLQQIKYLDDLSRIPMPMERPEYLNKDNYTYDISNLL